MTWNVTGTSRVVVVAPRATDIGRFFVDVERVNPDLLEFQSERDATQTCADNDDVDLRFGCHDKCELMKSGREAGRQEADELVVAEMSRRLESPLAFASSLCPFARRLPSVKRSKLNMTICD